MSSYPWIKDSSTLSGEPTNCLAVTSPTGLLLYLNSGGTTDYYIYSHSYPLYIVNDSYGILTAQPSLRYSKIYFNANDSMINLYTVDNQYQSITSCTVDGKHGNNKISLRADNPASSTQPANGALIEVDGVNRSIYLHAENAVNVKSTSGTPTLNVENSTGYTRITPNNIQFYYTTVGSYVDLSQTGVSINSGGGGSATWSQIIAGGGGGGGVTDIQAGSGISINSSTGSVTITNNGVVGLFTNTPSTIQINQYGSTFAVDYIGGGGGGGGDVYWSQLISPSTTYSQLVTSQGSNNVKFGLEADTTGYYDVAELRIDDTYIYSYTGYNNSGRAGYLKVGYDDASTSVNYTLLTNTINNPCTMATINSDMHLYANKQSGVQNGQGRMYLYANEVLPGNGAGNTNMGNGTQYFDIMYANNFNTTSDVNLKKDIVPLELDHSLKLISNINTVSYKYKNNKDDKKHFGVIAQEVKEIIGDEKLALHNDDNETQSVAYMELIAPLIKTVQHLLKKVESLENEIKILKQSMPNQ